MMKFGGAPVLIAAAFLFSGLLTGYIRHFLLRQSVLDIPNERSSHIIPTPRGGGLSIVVVVMLAVLWLTQRGTIASNVAWAVVAGGLLVAAAGIADDLFQAPALLRLLIHFVAAGCALWSLGGMGPLPIGTVIWNWGVLGQLVGLLGLVWMTTVYNYMDGIDGLAGMEAVYAGIVGGMLLASDGVTGLSHLALALAGASAGFLVWNFPSARIFMGDVGSGFLGFAFGVIAIASGKERPGLLWCWLILLAVFIVDATLTQIRRWLRGARWHQPHRTSAYQHAARLWRSHSAVTVTIAAVNVIWLCPLAWGAYRWPSVASLLAALALAPLIYSAFYYGAGREHTPREFRDLKHLP